MAYSENVLKLLSRSPSVFHVVDNMEKAFAAQGYQELREGEPFAVVPGKGYYVKRNGSSIIAFYVPTEFQWGMSLAATHNDSPSFAVKPHPFLKKGNVTVLNVEPYGGGIFYTWLDRPLSFAGRVYTIVGEEIHCNLVDIDQDLLVIPSLAIHMNRDVNNGYAFNAAKDMTPIFYVEPEFDTFEEYLKATCSLEGEVLSLDLFLYVRENPRVIGPKQDLVLSPRLDDLSSAYANLLAFLVANRDKKAGKISVFASFDNEEVGSLTAQGAHSDFLRSTVERMLVALGGDEEHRHMAIANALMLSVDNAHASHPNHMDKCDPTSIVNLNGGIVIKYNADQKYTTNAASSAYVKSLCLDLGQKFQEFTNRSDMRGGSTLGNISNAEVSILSADIGIAQLAMHSCVELCGLKDIEEMKNLLAAHYSR